MRHKKAGIQQKQKVLVLASVASMIGQFNLPNIRLLQELGCEVHVACNFKKGNTCDEKELEALREKLHKMHVIVHQWSCPRSAYSIPQCLRAYCSLRKLMEKHPFSWVHCQSPVGGALARMAAHRKHVRIIYTAHGFHFYKGAPLKNWLLYYPAEKLLAHWTDVLVTLNQEDYRLAKRSLKAGKVCYIPGVGVDTAQFFGCRRAGERREFCRKYQIPEDAVVLLSVGELSKRKNHQAVLDALARLADKKICYLVCGQGKLKNRLLRQAKMLGIQSRVRLAGFQKDVGLLYRNADIFVFPSVQEGLPVALMEAMAAGMPCVVSDIRGNRELVGRAGGIRFTQKRRRKKILFRKAAPSKNEYPATLLDALERLCADETLRQAFGAYNRQKIKNYDWKRVSVRMRKIYRQFLCEGGRAEGMGDES
ncbi:MAG: glycosyltransferase [Eubacterium sp.]|nr:glycosyltransferase [Eubacterium sp.]